MPSMSLTIFPESTHQFPGKSCLPRRTIRGEARLFVLDFVTAVSAAEEEEEGERGREGATHYSGSLGRETVGLRSLRCAAAPEISRLPDASLTFLAFLV